MIASRTALKAGLLFGCLWVECANAQDAGPPPVRAPDATVQGIVGTAQRPKSEARIDPKVFVVSGNLQGTTGSAADVLNEVPSVDVDPDGALTLRGDPNVTIVVDGKPSAAFTGAAAGLSLLQFPASEIDRIEVSNPPAQYKAEGSGGVINIITTKSRKAGLSGSLRVSAAHTAASCPAPRWPTTAASSS